MNEEMKQEKEQTLDLLALTHKQKIEKIRSLATEIALVKRDRGEPATCTVDEVYVEWHRAHGQKCPRKDRFGRVLPCQPECTWGEGKVTHWTGSIFRGRPDWKRYGLADATRCHQGTIMVWEYIGKEG